MRHVHGREPRCSWPGVLARIEAYGGSAAEVLYRATVDGVPPQSIRDAIDRAESWRSEHQELPEFVCWEATAPGLIDVRVFDQTLWWVDVLRRPHLIAEMDIGYVRNVIDFLHERAEVFGEAYHLGEGGPMTRPEAADWLEATPLMRALRAAAEEWE